MKKLYVIGDSFSSKFYEPQEAPDSWKNKYIDYKGYEPKFFGEFITEELGIDYEILTKGPHDNFKMIECFIDNLDKFNDGDILSFGWTDPSRLRFVDFSTNEWEVINAHNMTGDYLCGVSVSTLIEWAANRQHKLYGDELIKWTKLINKSLPNVSIIHWTWGNNSYLPFDRIVDDTNGIINDLHWSERGHQQFANWFLDVYNKKIENKCFENWVH
jgi:hypothetical protein